MTGGTLTEQGLRDQLGARYLRFDSAKAARHLELLARCQRRDEVAIYAHHRLGSRYEVTVCAADGPGMLATIAGLITAHRATIASADVFTVASEEAPRSLVSLRGLGPKHLLTRPAPITRKVLDVFDVTLPAAVEASYWRLLEEEISALIVLGQVKDFRAVREVLLRPFSQALADTISNRTTTPVRVEVDNDSDPRATLIRVESVDTFGFFFEFASGLELLKINVHEASVATEQGRIRDTFWVNDLRGLKITSPERIQEIRVGTALIQQFAQLLPHSPNPDQALAQFGEFISQLLTRPGWANDLHSLESAAVLQTMAEMLGGSQFLWQDFLRIQHENLFPIISSIPEIERRRTKEDVRAELESALAQANSVAEKVNQINRLKDREMFRIDLQHITGRVDFAGFGDALSDLSEVVIETSARLSEELMNEKFGRPALPDGAPCPWSGLVLGKLGGREMGFASDLEMIFVYEGHGMTDGESPVENMTYFEQFVTDFLRSPKAARDGIFEIDLRLRPFGRAGNMACTLDIFSRFFSVGGQADTFHRLALVKLRPVAGDADLGQRVLTARDAYVYSGEPIPWSEIRLLRQMQCQQLVPARAFSAKHSPGGLVDIEYFVQAVQLDVGARVPEVRLNSTLDAIDKLQDLGVFSSAIAEQLTNAYAFWRLVIDALRCVRGNSHDLTVFSESSPEFVYLSRRLRDPSPRALANHIERHTAFVKQLLHEPARSINFAAVH
jgi:glutamate-ammonia-ligase adenylyltransferase